MAVSEKMRRKLEKRKEEIKKGNGDFNTILFPVGTTRIRILPVGDEDFAQEVIQFFLGKEIGAIVSPATFGDDCAIYDAHNELKSSGDEDDKETANSFKPAKRYYAPAIKYKDEKGTEVEGKERLAVLPGGVYSEMIDLFLDDENGDFLDPKKGYDLKIKREGEGKNNTTYKVIPCKPTKLPKEFAKKIYDPEAMVRELLPTYAETEEAINKFLNLADDDDDEPKKKKGKKSSSSKKGKSDMDEKPKKKKKKTSEEAPKKKKKKK